MRKTSIVDIGSMNVLQESSFLSSVLLHCDFLHASEILLFSPCSLSFSYVIITYVNVTYQKGDDNVRVVAYTQKCIAGGNCVLACAEVFDQRDSDGTVHVLNERPALTLLEKVRRAVDLCPGQVFTIEDEANQAEFVVIEDDREV